MAVDLTSIYNSSDQIEYLVQIYMKSAAKPKAAMEARKTNLEERKTVLTKLDSKLTTLRTKSESLTDEFSNSFATKTASTSDSDKFTASAGSSAELGNHSISVERLAISDTRVSKQFTDSSSSFAAITADQTFSIEVGHTDQDTDTYSREAIQVTVAADVFSQTDEEVLLAIADAINTAMSDAVSTETINSSEVIHASVVTEETGKSRLIFRSELSGYTNRMDFSDSADLLLTTLEVNNAAQSSGSSGGWITQVGTSATDSLLNAKMNIDGLTFYRDSNNVTDAISGVTLQLLDTFATTETITINADVAAVTEEVNSFITAYNESLEYLEDQTRNSTSEDLGLLSRDLIYKNMINDLRNIARQEVTGAASLNYTTLFNLGIESDDSGQLSIKDMEKFTTALESNSNNISDIFRASDGVATRIEDYLAEFVKTGGTIDDSKKNIDNQLIYMNDRIKVMEEQLVKKEAALRNEFARLQQMMAALADQQSFFNTFMSSR
ncbi:MAG: flagellar filament capping protein FliD [Candidatus Neomarinimicrobiota bacterium]